MWKAIGRALKAAAKWIKNNPQAVIEAIGKTRKEAEKGKSAEESK